MSFFTCSTTARRPIAAEVILGQGPRISVQVLNESLVNCRRKAGLSWEEAAAFLEGVRALCPVEDLTVQTHDVGRALAERYGFSIYDAMIVASAFGCGVYHAVERGHARWPAGGRPASHRQPLCMRVQFLSMALARAL